ncbi:hypothetical protein ABZ687_29305 [Streptomyces ardesiacus]|uniref:hypothetical protein n=1 Tax=Streptomyces ardesiacus TaxID=285564 RepID=UPI0033F9F8E3
MTSREHAAPLAAEASNAERFSFLLEEALGGNRYEAFLEQRRTLKRILTKVFPEKSRHEGVRRAIKSVIDHAVSDDWLIHFSTGTSYSVQLKSRSTSATAGQPCYACSDQAPATDSLDVLLHPLPPSERAALLLGQAKYAMSNAPSTVPKTPRKQEREKFGHMAVTVKERGQYQGVFRVADEVGSNEAYRYTSSDLGTLGEQLDAWELRTFAIFVDFDSECAAAVIEPKAGSLSRSSEVARALDIDLLLYLGGGASE